MADPGKYPNLFTDLDSALEVEKMFLKARDNHIPANSYPTAKSDLELDLIAIVKSQAISMDELKEDKITPPTSVEHVAVEEELPEEVIEVTPSSVSVDAPIEVPALVSTPVIPQASPVSDIVENTLPSVTEEPKDEEEDIEDIEDVDELLQEADRLTLDEKPLTSVPSKESVPIDDDDFNVDEDEEDW